MNKNYLNPTQFSRNLFSIVMLCFLMFFSSKSFAGNVTITSTNGSTATVSQGLTKQAIVRVAVDNPNGGSQGTETLTSMTFKLANTNNLDITKAQLWYSGGSSLFSAATTQLGADVTVFGATVTFSGFSQNLPKGSTYYFWLTYDISATATVCSNYVDGYQDSSALITFSTLPGVAFSDTSTPNSRQILGPGCWTYCTAGGSLNTTGHLSNVTFNTINRNSTFDGYIDTGLTTTVFKTLSYNLSITKTLNAAYNTFTEAWIDWNNDGDFADAGEIVLAAASSTTSPETRTISVTVPAGAATGTTRMRVMYKYNVTPVATGCDTSTSYMDVEDYNITILPAVACTTPATQPTLLSLTPTAAGFNGSFTAAIPAPNNYIVVANTTGVTPSPANGTTYTVGGTMGAGNIVTAITSGTTFTTNYLSGSTFYYLYIFSMNDLCTGGPLYQTIAPPLSGSGTTLVESYCTPGVTTSAYSTANYISQVNFIGNFTNSNNGPTTGGATSFGYSNYTGLGPRASQAQGEGVNIFLDTNQANAVFMKAWVDWNKDGNFDDTTEIVYQCSNAFLNTTFGFQVPLTANPGNYRIRIRINRATVAGDMSYNTYSACGVLANYGETEDYLFTVIQNCDAKISSISPGFNCGTGTVTLGAVGTAGTTQYRWYDAATGGSLVGSTASTTWVTPSISATTTYYVTAFNGTCESTYRTAVVASVKPVATLTFSNANPTVCGENSIIDLSATGNVEQVYLIDENFEGGLGVFTAAAYGSQTSALTNWQVKTSTYVPQYPTYPVWYPAISSGFGTNKFAMTTSDIVAGGNTFGKIDNAIESVSVNSTGFLNLTLTFNMYFSSYYDNNSASTEYVVAEYKNGAGAWTLIPGGQFLVDVGIGTQFVAKSLNMNTLTNINNLKVRIRYKAGWCDGVAIDDVKLFGDKTLIPNITWTSALPVDAYTDAACTTPYVAGTPVSSVWVKPTLAQLEQGTYSFTANANLTNGCTISGTINVTNNSKVWKGTTSTDWGTASNWQPVGVPDANTCVIIPSNSIISGAGYKAYGKNLTIKSTGNLDLQPSNFLTIGDWVKNEGGVFNIRNTGSLVQINNVANTGNINMERTANIRQLDYVYWASPVTSFASSAISPGTSTGLIYKWTPTIGANINGFGNWVAGSENMTLGKGYIVRGPDTWPSTLQNYTATFTGVPNNGNIPVSISRGTYNGVDYNTGVSGTLGTKDDDNWNLIGNPYPSSVNAIAFLTANTNIAGYINVWTHGTLPSSAIPDPFYNDYVMNYTPGDYITYNSAGASSGPGVFGGNIGAGQGFFVSMLHTSAATTENVTFTNAMRSNNYSNSQFFRSADDLAGAEDGRIWLDLFAPDNSNVRTLVAYVNGATNDSDRMYDAFTSVKSDLNIYSVLNDENLVIQGRAIPFTESDEVPLGIKTTQNGIYTIGIGALDGLFTDASKTIYLHDLVTNTIHDLRTAPYTFTAETGKINDRFVLKYVNNTLSNNDFNALENSVFVFANGKLNVKSNIESIKDITVYDVLGRVLTNATKVNAKEFTFGNLSSKQATLIIKITLENNVVITKKVIY